jgi:hypothetical protein
MNAMLRRTAFGIPQTHAAILRFPHSGAAACDARLDM